MHIPDGFIAPKAYLPAYAVAAAAWAIAARRARRGLRHETIPYLSVMTAVAFTLMMIAVPLPGGTTAHASGIALLALLFDVWLAFLCISLVLIMQALLFAQGGVTSLPINALAMGLVGSAAASLAWRLLRRVNETAALFVAGWLSVNLAALCVAIVLGLQPLLARGPDGTPLFFPFGLRTTIPAVMLPHLLVGVGEGVLTVMVYRLVARLRVRPGAALSRSRPDGARRRSGDG